MSFEEENRSAICAYFAQGAKGNQPCEKLGVEVEHFVVDAATLKAIPYEGEKVAIGRVSEGTSVGVSEGATKGTSAGISEHASEGASGATSEAAFGVRDILLYLSEFYPREMRGLEGDLIGLANEEASLTLEPAAQLEISIAPYCAIADIVRVYTEFRGHVDSFLRQHKAKLVTLGYHPIEKAHDLSLIPKKRYHFMNDYFHALGTHGERMMRASASTQVSIDYRDEADAIRKMRVAQALVPIIAAFTDNVVRFESETPKPLSRLAMWRDVDNARCGQVPGLFEAGFGFEQYAAWLLRTCPIFVTRPSAKDPQGPALRDVAGATASQAYADAPMSQDDIEHLLSMFWPDVRLKQFVEIRPADALPLQAMAGYAALIKGIFYSEESLARVEDAFGVAGGRWQLDDTYTDTAAESIRALGWKAQVGDLTLTEWRETLFDQAKRTLVQEEQRYLENFEKWIAQNSRLS